MSDPLFQPIAGVAYAEAEPETATPQETGPPPPPYAPPSPRSLIETLVAEPRRFGFDAALAILMQAAGTGHIGDAVRFHAAPGLGFVPADVLEIERDADGARATIGLLGLTGPSGVLPRPYTETLNAEQRRRSAALGDFLDLVAQRAIAQFAEAGIKYRPHRAAAAAHRNDRAESVPRDGIRDLLLALTGYGTPHLAERLAVGTEPLLFYAGFFTAYPRSADRLAAMLSDWLGLTVEVEQFAGTWLSLGADQMSALPVGDRPGNFHRLGVDAAIGERAWDPQSRILLHIGPLDLAGFDSFRPDRPLLGRLAALTRAFLGFEVDFAVNPILAAYAVPPLGMSGEDPPRLGWNSWLPTSGARTEDGVEAVFASDLIAGTAPCFPPSQ